MEPQNSDNNPVEVQECEWDNLIDRFKVELVANEKSALTIRNYRRELRAFAAWHKSVYNVSPSIDDLTAEVLREFKESLRVRDLKPGTINLAVASLRAFLKWAEETGTAREHVRTPKLAKQQNRVPKWLTKPEERRLLKAVHNGEKAQHIGLVDMLLVFGLRVSEMAGLTWGDVIMSHSRGELRVFGKGAKERILPFAGNQRARDALKLLGWKRYGKGHKNRRILHGQRGPMSASGIKQLLTPYGRAAQLVPFHSHILRHTCARRMYERNTPIQVIARWMGHENINTTMLYTLPSEADLAKAAGATDDGWDMDGEDD